MERSAEWLRGAAHAAAECKQFKAAGWYQMLLAEAEAREASVPTAAEVIAAAEKALATIADPIECGCKPCTGDCQSISAKAIYFEGQQEVAAEALSVIARWKEANGG